MLPTELTEGINEDNEKTTEKMENVDEEKRLQKHFGESKKETELEIDSISNSVKSANETIPKDVSLHARLDCDKPNVTVDHEGIARKVSMPKKPKKRLMCFNDSSSESSSEDEDLSHLPITLPIEEKNNQNSANSSEDIARNAGSSSKPRKRVMHVIESSDESDTDDKVQSSNDEMDSSENLLTNKERSTDIELPPKSDNVKNKQRKLAIVSDESDLSDASDEEMDIGSKTEGKPEVSRNDSSKPLRCDEHLVESASNSSKPRLLSDGPEESDDDSSPFTSQQPSELFTAEAASAIASRQERNEDASDDESNDESSSSSSQDSDDDDAPPIRIFRNKNAAAMNSRGYDSGNDLSEDEGLGDVGGDSPPPITRRKPKRTQLPSSLEMKSETQRLIRESRVNLPYHVPETKKLSQFLKRPVPFQRNSEQEDSKRDSGVEIPDIRNEEEDENEKKEEKSIPQPSLDTPMTGNRKSQLLARVGVAIPALNPVTIDAASNPATKFIDLDVSSEESPPKTGISHFMERFLKHSSLEKSVMSKKKVQFNIIRKEERADGTGVDLVPDVVIVTPSKDAEEAVTAFDYKRMMKLRMKKKRLEERQKRHELYKLDNEEIGSEKDEEEEEWTDDEVSEEEEEDAGKDDNEVDDESKNKVISDDDENDDDVMDKDQLDPTQPVNPELNLSNVSSLSKVSQNTLRSDSASSHLTREGSLLLFDDVAKKSSCSREGSLQESASDSLYSALIPPNKPKNSELSDSFKMPRMGTDEDSYFCSGRSTYTASAASPSRTEYESQFFDSNGFIKEPKTNKSINTLLPPGGEDDNANDGNMSQLLELCSGTFQVSEINPHISDAETSTDVNGAFIDESFGFQVEGASIPREESNRFSDDDDAGSSEPEEEDEPITIVRRKKDVAGKMAKNFLEDEAELSGDDIGSDDNDDDANNEDFYEIEENDEVLPEEEIMQQQVNKVHLKQLLDEDQRDIDLLQEAFVTDNIETRRTRKFRWKNIDDNMTQDLFHSDGDEDDPDPDDAQGQEEEMMGSEESQWRMLRLKREEFLNSKTNSEDTENALDIEEDSQLFRMGKAAMKRVRSSDVNEDEKTNSEPNTPSLSRSSSLNGFVPLQSRNSFLARKPEVLSKYANFKEATVLNGAVNSDRMVFKAVSPSKKNVRVKRPATRTQPELKRPRLDEDSNSIFNLFEM